MPFFWAVSISPVRPALLPNFACRFETSRFAEAIPHDGIIANGERQRSFGIGESIYGLEESQKGRSFDGQCSVLHV